MRERLPHYFSPEVAAVAGLTVQELQQAVFGVVTLTDQQIELLARRMRIAS